MIRHDFTQKLEPKQRHLRKHAPFIGDAGRQNEVERRDAVRSNNQQAVAIFINVADLASGESMKSGKSCFENGFVIQPQLY